MNEVDAAVNAGGANAQAGPPCGDRYCIGCGQSLLGVTLGRCPECGRGFDARDLATTAPAHPPSLWQLFAKVLGHIATVWSVVVPLLVLASATGNFDTMLGLLLALLLAPAAALTTALMCVPSRQVSDFQRVKGLIFPAVAVGTMLTNWPLYISIALHRPLFNRAAIAVAQSGPRGPCFVGIIHCRQVAIANGSVAFQLTGTGGGGMYFVRDDPATPFVWYNTNWEIDFGSDWYLVYED